MVGRLFLVIFSLVISPALAAGDNPTIATSSQRVALVVGNGIYDQVDEQLKNPANDATAIAANLRALGVEVIEAINVDYRGLREVLRKFDRALQGADAGIFYYAGHGMEYRGQNYLFPTDAVLETEGDVGLGLVDIDQVLQVMETAVPTRLVFLDACRNNPLARGFRNRLGAGRSAAVGRGLGRIDAAVGTFIAYATAPGDIAADGKGDNSPFTTAMLQHLDEPGLEISQLMHKVRNSVIEATSEKQIPWESSSLRGPFVLNLDVTVKMEPSTIPSTSADDSQRAEIVFWESIKDSGQLASFEAYVERFGKAGVFTSLAKTRIKVLQEERAKKNEAILNFDKRRVQEALATLGYDTGATDGIFGPQTRRAIKAWQEDNGEAVTSYLSTDQASAVLKKATTTSRLNKPSSSAKIPDHHRKQTSDGYKKAAILYQKSCSNGNADGCANLGYQYEHGFGLEQDVAKAAGLYQQTCDDDYAWSCGRLGYLYQEGKGVEQDIEKAVNLYQTGCEGGHEHSCGSLAYYYMEGIELERDYPKAVMLYRRACDEGIAWSCGKLGYLYQEGKGAEQDIEKAISLYQKSCDGGAKLGCGNLGYYYEKGKGVEQDIEKARGLYKKACDEGYAWSCGRLGSFYQEGKGVDPDHEKAEELYQKACLGEDAKGCTKLGALKKR